MKVEEIKKMTDKELQERIDAGKGELLRLKLSHSISPLDNPSQISKLRKDVARFSTELRMRELNNK